jgi:hypothetical protein
LSVKASEEVTFDGTKGLDGTKEMTMWWGRGRATCQSSRQHLNRPHEGKPLVLLRNV